jgi:hypothetical protein
MLDFFRQQPNYSVNIDRWSAVKYRKCYMEEVMMGDHGDDGGNDGGNDGCDDGGFDPARVEYFN